MLVCTVVGSRKGIKDGYISAEVMEPWGAVSLMRLAPAFRWGSQVSYCVTGDGGFQMNIQELETVKRGKFTY